MPSPLRCAHISDLHFAKPTWNLSQFFSKRWLGNMNLLFSRKKVYTSEYLPSLIDIFKEQHIKQIFITGDVTTTSAKEEFLLAQHYVSSLKQAGFNVFVIPGNHDHYTSHAYNNRLFYQFFNSSYAPASTFNLKEHGLTAAQLDSEWCLILLDTALATSLISSCGFFSEKIENNLEHALKALPPNQKVILANHFPFFCNDSPRKKLIRGPHLRALIERFPQIRCYIHGHTHRHCIADLRESGLPIVLDSGSTSHQKKGSWNLIELSETGCTVQPYYLEKQWVPKEPQTFTWS